MDNPFDRFSYVVPGKDAWRFVVRAVRISVGGSHVSETRANKLTGVGFV